MNIILRVLNLQYVLLPRNKLLAQCLDHLQPVESLGSINEAIFRPLFKERIQPKNSSNKTIPSRSHYPTGLYLATQTSIEQFRT